MFFVFPTFTKIPFFTISLKSFKTVLSVIPGKSFLYSLFVILFFWLIYSIAFFCRSFNSNDSRFSGIWNFLKTTAKPPVTSLNIGSGKPSFLHHFIMSFVPDSSQSYQHIVNVFYPSPSDLGNKNRAFIVHLSCIYRAFIVHLFQNIRYSSSSSLFSD